MSISPEVVAGEGGWVTVYVFAKTWCAPSWRAAFLIARHSLCWVFHMR